MGNILGYFFQPKGDYLIHVQTGDRLGAGTDANVWVVLIDSNDRRIGPFHLDGLLRNDFERGQRDTFGVTGMPGDERGPLGPVFKIELWRDASGMGDSWFLDLVAVEKVKPPRRIFFFPIQRWVKPHTRYVFHEFDSVLPQFDPRPGPRAAELAEKRTIYDYIQHVEGGPAQIKLLPADELFSECYYLNFGLMKKRLEYQAKYIRAFRPHWTSLDDLKELYDEKSSMPPPETLAFWYKDCWFAQQRLTGVNPVMIRLCKEIPDKFGVTNKMVSPSLEGYTLLEALDKNKLFICDLEILIGVPCKPGCEICIPIALFYLNKKNELLPVAIQLQQEKADDNPVFLPSDTFYVWTLAKMFYNNADAQIHQSLTHLGLTHLLMEGVVICTHRHLSPSHPVFRLLSPHFLFLLAINTRGLEKLINRGGWVDRGMNIGYDGMMYLIAKGLARWKFDGYGCIPLEIESRGVLDPKILPNYYYRDDAVAIYNCLHHYVQTIINRIYDTESKLLDDFEIQAWRHELSIPRDKGGAGLEHLPGSDTDDIGFKTNAEVVDVLTVIICTCSVAHAASNFRQYQEYSFLPNYPGMLLGQPPKDKKTITEDDILTHLPDRYTVLDIMQITRLLSMKATNSLGDFEVQYAYDPASTDAVMHLQKELNDLSLKIQDRNKQHNIQYPYTWLDPAQVPNAISV